MSNWLILTDEDVQNICLAISPRFVGEDQKYFLALADIVAASGYNRAFEDGSVLMDFRTELQSDAGASLIGSTTDSNVQADLDSLNDRMAEIESSVIHAESWGLKGDGTDETADIQSMLNSAIGRVVVLGESKTYGMTAITIPANTTLIHNNSKFKKLSGGATYGITVQGPAQIDSLIFDSVGGANDAGIQITGNDVEIGKVKITSLAVNSGNASDVLGLLVYNSEVTPVKNLKIGELEIHEYCLPFRTRNVDGIQLGKVTIDNYKVGYYCVNTKNGKFYGSSLSGMSPTATGAAGQHGLLIESTTADATANLEFHDWNVSNSPSSSIRITDNHRVKNVKFFGGSSYASGSGASASGAAGFKVIGSAANVEYHEDIYVDGMVIEDCALTGSGTDAFAAMQIGMVKNGEFKFTVKKRLAAYSCWIGMTALSNENVNIYPNIQDCKKNAGKFITAATYPTTMKDVVVHGGKLQVDSTTTNAVIFDAQDNTFDNVSIVEQCQISGGIAGTQHITPTTGAYTNCMLDIIRIRAQSTTTDPPTVNDNNILVRMIGPLYGTTHTQGSNGSVVIDTATGAFKIRKAGVWTTL